MKIEKISENKIRITMNMQELAEKNIDLHSFMSNSLESQDIFIDMLEEAEAKVGFITKNHRIKIEALAMFDGEFIVTVTKFGTKTTKLKTARKKVPEKGKQAIYKFNCFEDFCDFSNIVRKIKNYEKLIKIVKLFLLKDTYYLCLDNICMQEKNIEKVYCLLSEFSTHISNSEVFIMKLEEQGKLVIKNNAIKICNEYFNKKKM